MKQALFYLLESSEQPDVLAQSDTTEVLSEMEHMACVLATALWRDNKRILIACVDQQQAERLDDALWQQDPNAFVPHNLAGEGPRRGAPVELCWPQRRGSAARDILISLLPEVADFASAFHQVIDFVPYDETAKQLARERYKVYRRIGFHLTTARASDVAPPLSMTESKQEQNG